MTNKIKVGEIKPRQTVEEFDSFLETYKAKNPQKFAAKEANGEFNKYRKTLVGYIPPKVEELKVEEPKVEEPKFERPKGRPKTIIY